MKGTVLPNVIKLACHCEPLRPQARAERNCRRRLLARSKAHWCGNLLRFWGFPRQFENWLGMTAILNLMPLVAKRTLFYVADKL